MEESIFSISDENTFNQIALSTFHFQYHNNPIYKRYCDLIGTKEKRIEHYSNIPFLPIQFFKSENVLSGDHPPEVIFKSSGTGGDRSSHYVSKKEVYERSFMSCFESFFGSAKDFAILALLPSYLEQGESSLVYMCEKMIQTSKEKESGFFLYDHKRLAELLASLKLKKRKTLLIGVSYALIDFSESYQEINFPELIVMETGGMKGRKKELTRAELHQQLKDSLGMSAIHSEYGMTELLSQAYSKKDGIFQTPPWMKIILRKQEDPFGKAHKNEVGGINIIDLANLYSCSFIQTDDLGRVAKDGFEVLGRFDNAEVRGCSQMAI